MFTQVEFLITRVADEALSLRGDQSENHRLPASRVIYLQGTTVLHTIGYVLPIIRVIVFGWITYAVDYLDDKENGSNNN